MAKISLNQYETLMSQAADKMRELQESNRDLLAACEAGERLIITLLRETKYTGPSPDELATVRAAVRKAKGEA